MPVTRNPMLLIEHMYRGDMITALSRISVKDYINLFSFHRGTVDPMWYQGSSWLYKTLCFGVIGLKSFLLINNNYRLKINGKI